jgi:hypothetical protein
MTETTFVVDRSMVGTVIGPIDGYLQSVSMTSPPSRYESAVPSPDGSVWASGVFAIRGEGNFADMINVDQNSPSKKFTRLNFGYKGGLRVRSVPVGSVWQIVLSDQPVVRRKAA